MSWLLGVRVTLVCHMNVFWDMTPCKQIEIRRHFGVALQAPSLKSKGKPSKQPARSCNAEPREETLVEIQTVMESQTEPIKASIWVTNDGPGEDLSIYQYTYLLFINIYLSTYLSICLSLHPSICLSTHISVYNVSIIHPHLSTYLHIYYLSICLSTYISI